MITGAQIRKARALLAWTARRLAQEAGVTLTTIERAEQVEGEPPLTTERLKAIQATLEGAGVEFIPENGSGAGVRLRKDVVS